MKYEADPADYIPKARSMPGVEYEGDWGSTEWAQWDRYLRLHAGRSILWSARAHVLGLRAFDSAMTVTFLAEKIAEIEREIDEMKR